MCFLNKKGGIVFSTTLNNISVISWRSVLLVEETGVLGIKPSTFHKSLTNLITYFCIEYTSPEQDSVVVIGTNCIGSCKSNYHTITTTTLNIYKKNLKIPKGQPEAVNRRKTDYTMTKRKKNKGQTMRSKNFTEYK